MRMTIIFPVLTNPLTSYTPSLLDLQMLLFAAIFGCLSPALTIAAALAYKDPFVLPIDKKNMADEAKRAFAGDSCR